MEFAWSWEAKVERLRKILEKQALEQTHDVCESTRSTDFFSIESVSVKARVDSTFCICILHFEF